MSDPKSSKPPDYAVGYRRPPIATRFKAGSSGNPKGRPKGSKNFNTLFAEELAQTITLTESGKRKKMAKRQALVKQLVNKALTNDPKGGGAGPRSDSAQRSIGQPRATGRHEYDGGKI